MDFQLASETGTPPTWDCAVVPLPGGGDYVPMISGAAEDAQEAEVACGLILGGVPQLDGVGVDHLGFLGGSVNIGQLESQIRAMLAAVGRTDYSPLFDIAPNGQLVVIPTKVGS